MTMQAAIQTEERVQTVQVQEPVSAAAQPEAALSVWKEKARVLLFTALIGGLCICLILLSAYTANSQYNLNRIEARCEAITSEIADLSANLQGAASIVTIEAQAKQLGMVYPGYNETVTLTVGTHAEEHLAAALKTVAYSGE